MIRVILVGGIKIFSLFVFFFPQNLIFFVKMLFYFFLKKIIQFIRYYILIKIKSFYINQFIYSC